MFSLGKKSKITHVMGRCLRMLLILGSIAICIEACSKDPEEVKKDPPTTTKPPGEGNQGGGQDTIVTPSDSLEADVISQYLKLVNATKITGQPPEGVDGAIGIDVKDTIYLTLGLPIGDRVSFLHNPTLNVTGFYVYVPGASYYYDVPNVPEEAKDSTDVVYVDAEFPVADFKDYPISFPLHIMPYVDGIPFKSFIKPVKIDDPKDPDEADACSSILGRDWQWEFTIRKYNDEIRQLKAPGLRVGINVLLGGCCRDDGASILAGTGCSKIDSLRGNRLTWIEFPSLAGQTDLWELLSLEDDGRFRITGKLDEAAIIPDTRNFCTKKVDYTFNLYSRSHDGNHDFTPGDNTVNLTFDPFQGAGPVSFLHQNTYELQYTCHQLILTRKDGEGGEWGFVYKTLRPGFADFQGEDEWYDNVGNPFLITNN